MLLDQRQALHNYRALGDRFARAFDFVRRFDPATPDGRLDLEGDAVFALVQSYETAPADRKQFESHRLYADVQWLAVGREIIQYAPVATLVAATPYDAPKDCLLYSDPLSATDLRLSPDSVAVFWPQDGHKPGCADGAPAPVRKVVVKVRL